MSNHQKSLESTTQDHSQPDVVRTDFLEPSLESSPVQREREAVSPTGGLTTILEKAYDEMNNEDLVLSQLAKWRPAIGKVTNPVAFMTSASKENEKIKKGGGNYDKAVQSKTAADGFYELAKSECRRLSSEIISFSAGIPAASRGDLDLLAAFMESYATLYETIQRSGSASTEDGRKAMSEKALASLFLVRSNRALLGDQVLGTVAGSIDQAILDIGTFLGSWSVVTADSGSKNASKAMWGLFLQTVERYRQILNQYDKLDDIGDSTGTAKMSVRQDNGTPIRDSEEAEAFAISKGGYMAIALKSYGFYKKDADRMVVQLNEIIARLDNGEFETEQECVAAFKGHIGGGQASELFLKDIADVAKMNWSKYLTKLNHNLHNKFRESANEKHQSLYSEAGASFDAESNKIGSLETTIDRRDLQAQTAEDNEVYLGMSNEEIRQIGKDIISGKRAPMNETARKALIAKLEADGDYKTAEQLLTKQEKADRKAQLEMSIELYRRQGDEYMVNFLSSSGAHELEVAAAKNNRNGMYIPEGGGSPIYTDALQVHHKPIYRSSGPEIVDYEDVARNHGISQQQSSYQNMDASGTAKAYDDALKLHEEAIEALRAVKENLNSSAMDIHRANYHFMESQRYLAETKIRMQHITGDHPVLVAALAQSEKQVEQLQIQIERSGGDLSETRAYQKLLEARIEKSKGRVEGYNPEKKEVPAPTATVDGQDLELEEFQRMVINLKGPAFPPCFFWVGGLEGEYAKSKKGASSDKWHSASVEIYAGLEADLALVKGGVKLFGFFKASKKNAEGLRDTLTSGAEELGRWGYSYWYDLDGIGDRIVEPIDHATKAIDDIYDGLDPSRENWASQLKQAKKDVGSEHELLGNNLVSAVAANKNVNFNGRLMADKVLPINEINEGLDFLETVEQSEREDAIKGEKRAFGESVRIKKNEVVQNVVDLDPGTNDPNVEFEAGVGIEGYFDLGGSVSPVKMEQSSRAVFTISDGSGHEFDTSIESNIEFQMVFDVLGCKAKAVFIPKRSGHELEASIELPLASMDIDSSALMKSLSKSISAISESTEMGWLNQLKSVFQKSAELKGMSGRSVAKLNLKIGASLKLDKSNRFKSGSLYVAIISLMETGTFEFEKGNKVTYNF